MVTKGDEMVMKWFIAKTSVCPAKARNDVVTRPETF